MLVSLYIASLTVLIEKRTAVSCIDTLLMSDITRVYCSKNNYFSVTQVLRKSMHISQNWDVRGE